MEEAHEKNLRKTPEEMTKNHSWQLARKWGPQSYNFKEINSANNHDLGPELWAPEEMQSDTMISAQYNMSERKEYGNAMPMLLTYKNYEITFCCVRPLSLW